MPILEIELIGKPPPEVYRGLSGRLAEAAGQALSSRPRGTWVKVRVLDEDDYAENGGGTGEDPRPVFVSITKRHVPEGADLKREVTALTDAIARTCERPTENVHILYQAPAAGRLAFGGHLVE